MKDCCFDDSRKKLNILITGKSTLLHSLMLELHNLGHSISIAKNPRETLFIYASQQPDLIIFADFERPFETFSSIREINQDAEAIFIIDVNNPKSFESLFDFHNVSFIPSTASATSIISNISEYHKKIIRNREIEENSKLYDLILQGLPFPALLVGSCTGKTIMANKSALKTLPIKSSESSIPFISFLAEDVRNNLFTDQEAYRIHSLKSVCAYERFWDLTIEQVAPSVFLLLALDVTEQRKQLQLREEMERIARHDLRSPTATIVGMSRILETEADLSDDYQRLAEIVRTTSERMIRQIDTSLTLIRLETGSLVADSHPFNLFRAITAAIGDISQLVDDKKLEIICFLEDEPLQDECPLVCYGEASLIITMFSNLIKNAAEAAPDNSTITVRLHDTEQSIITEIHNLGEVPSSIKNSFFDRYATHGKRNGTGLGTYSSKLIAKVSGGDISFTSSWNQGTTLITTLPKPPENLNRN
ncbi:Histidine kinase-, DNA gyrase B-, and HSP90-like ATPase [Maridesulfovibrio ferrireducens]|uniref:histidine kinase n=1 Tax=Maridesulfovibrio ferrireducens TaxID=246191 RepID=A0A1G9IZA5_9BACT|nr:hybrid sensor histidine kinase/response regulator [Maridesulfovibrio ferrireducens]SDL30579.1 Histidine kinase-, DNA gyrase B-, and HSP90-like ATPase [Maridesulfovibrio ferrireducens]